MWLLWAEMGFGGFEGLIVGLDGRKFMVERLFSVREGSSLGFDVESMWKDAVLDGLELVLSRGDGFHLYLGKDIKFKNG